MESQNYLQKLGEVNGWPMANMVRKHCEISQKAFSVRVASVLPLHTVRSTNYQSSSSGASHVVRRKVASELNR